MKYSLASIYQNDTCLSFEELEELSSYADFSQNTRQQYWYADGNPTTRQLHVLRGVFSTQDINELIGVIRFDIPEHSFRSMLDNALLTESTSAFLVNGTGTTVGTSKSGHPERNVEIAEKILSLRDGNFSGETWNSLPLDGEEYLIGSGSIADSEWTLFIFIPYRDILQMSSRPARKLFTVFFATLPFTLFLAFFVSRSATKRIQRLIGKTEKVVEGDFSVTLDPENRDEIGRLIESFNFMVSRIEELIEEKYRLGIEVKQLELRALQAQINPHFLYNTLDLINWKSMKYGAEEIRQLVYALSKFYKLSLSGGNDTVTLADELDHVRNYVRIQNMRYENAISLRIDIPGHFLEVRVPKLILQPLVENSILHGIMQKETGKGVISITADTEGDDLLIRTEDDGVGMSEDTVRKILNGEIATKDHHGYGVRNICERIRPEFRSAVRALL